MPSLPSQCRSARAPHACLCIPFLSYVSCRPPPAVISHMAVLSFRAQLLSYLLRSRFPSKHICLLCCTCSRAALSAPFLLLPHWRSCPYNTAVQVLSTVAIQVHFMAPTTTVCGNITLTRGASIARNAKNAGICFFPKLLGLSWVGWVLDLRKHGIVGKFLKTCTLIVSCER